MAMRQQTLNSPIGQATRHLVSLTNNAPLEHAADRLVAVASSADPVAAEPKHEDKQPDKHFADAERKKAAIGLSALRLQDELANILQASGITQEDLDNLSREQLQEGDKSDDGRSGN